MPVIRAFGRCLVVAVTMYMIAYNYEHHCPSRTSRESCNVRVPVLRKRFSIAYTAVSWIVDRAESPIDRSIGSLAPTMYR